MTESSDSYFSPAQADAYLLARTKCYLEDAQREVDRLGKMFSDQLRLQRFGGGEKRIKCPICTRILEPMQAHIHYVRR